MLQIVFQAKIGLILKQPAVFRLKLAVVQNADALRNRKLLCFPIRNGRNPARVLQICFFLFHLIFLFRGSAFFGRSRAVFLSKLSKNPGTRMAGHPAVLLFSVLLPDLCVIAAPAAGATVGESAAYSTTSCRR